MLKQRRFSGGVFLKSNWSTDRLPIEVLQPPPFVTIPLIQHAGTPSSPVVCVGDRVATGCVIGDSPDEGACPIHSSISGVVTAVARYPYSIQGALSVTIENDGSDEFASPIPYDKAWQESSPAELIEKIRLAGIVDGSGDGVALHRKLAGRGSAPALLLNALELEPWCSAGSRLLCEQAAKVLLGAAMCRQILGASTCAIAVDEKRSEPLSAIEEALKDRQWAGISTIKLKKPRYPAHDERFLPRLCGFGEGGCMVIGVAAAHAVAEAIIGLQPSCRRVITVAGPAVETPKNLLVPIGTPVRFLLDACGMDRGRVRKLVFGGPLSGRAVQDFDVPVTRGVSAVIPFEDVAESESSPCISCRRCREVCPVGLEPVRLAQLAAEEDGLGLGAWSVHECIECGCCAWACPAHIGLVHHIAFGKVLARQAGSAEAA